MAKRDAMGIDPLAALIGSHDSNTDNVNNVSNTNIESNTAIETKSLDKPRFTVRISGELQDRVRNACYWERETVTAFVERAFAAELERMEKERGEEYPQRAGELKAGRPVR